MNKSILILEENSVIHGLVGAALDIDGVTLHHEFNPDNYVNRARSLMPDLILISNADQASDYAVTRELKSEEPLAEVPLILLASSKETIEPGRLQELHVNGVVRKPFEASDLQYQVSRHLNMIDLIGSAFEYKQSQSIEEKADPLADLKVVDEDILGLLHQTEEGEAPQGEVPDVDFSPVLDEDALEETLQPEAAFEPVEQSGGEGGPVHVERMDFGAPLEEEGETIILGTPVSEEEEGLEELGEADLLEDETAEDADLQPTGFDQPLDLEEPTLAAGMEPPLDEIEVEIPEEDLDFAGLDEEGGVDELDVVALAEEEEEEPPPLPAAADAGEDIPLAVRRMMELKPVLSMDESEQETPHEEEEELLFAAGEEPSSDVGAAVDELDEVDLAQPSVFEDEELPVGEAPPEPATGAADEEEGEAEEFREEFLGDDEIDEERVFQAMQEVDAQIAEEEEDADLEGLEGLESDEKEMDELVAMAAAEAEAEGVPLVAEEDEELLLDQDEEAMMLSALEEEEAFDAAYDDAAVAGAATPPEREEITFPEEEGDSAEAEQPGPAPEEGEGHDLDFELEEWKEPPGAAPGSAADATPSDLDPELHKLEAEALGELEDLEESVAGSQGPGADPDALEEESDLLAEEPLTLEESEDSIRAAALEMGLEEPEQIAEPGLGADLGTALDDEEDELILDDEELPPLDEEPAPSLVDAMAAQDDGELEEDEATAPARADYPDFASDETGEEMLELGEVGEELELDATGEEEETAEELAEQDISEYIEDDVSEAEAEELADADLGGLEDDSEFDSVFAELQAEIAANPDGERLDEVLAKEGIRAAVDGLELGEPAEETNLTRAMGITELPGGAALAEPPASGGSDTLEFDAGGAVLDEEIKARLGAVLDEIITVSVRKAVHEEMPKLMEQMMKDDRPA